MTTYIPENIPEEMLIPAEDREFCIAMGQCLHDFRVARKMTHDDIAQIAGTTAEFIEKYECAELQMPLYQYGPLFKHFGYPDELSLSHIKF